MFFMIYCLIELFEQNDLIFHYIMFFNDLTFNLTILTIKFYNDDELSNDRLFNPIRSNLINWLIWRSTI